MAQVRLPVKNIEEGNTINFYLLENSIAFMRVFEFDGLVYGRISAWGYNELQDYEKLAHKILEIQRM